MKKSLNWEYLTYAHARIMVKNHFLYLRGEKEGDKAEFSQFDLSIPCGYVSNYWEIEYHYYHTYLEYEKHSLQVPFETYIFHDFINQDLTEADFSWTNVQNVKFKNAVLDGADFRATIFNPEQFSSRQREWMIFTDEDKKRYEDYRMTKMEKKRIEEEKKIIENIAEGNELKLEIRDVQDQTKFITFFEDLAKDLRRKAENWLHWAFWIWWFLFLLLFIPIVAQLWHLWILGRWCNLIEIPTDLIVLTPLLIFLMTILYYCLKQYYSFYKLSLQYRNKVALIRGYLWIKAGEEKEIIQNLADRLWSTVFTEPDFWGDTKWMPMGVLLTNLERLIKINKDVQKPSPVDF